jgi:hypothetical protein
MAKSPIPENCSAHVPMILKEFCSSYTSEAACQHNFSETTEQNFMKLGR